MSDIQEITVSVGRTVNLGNFESLRVDLSARATVNDTPAEEVRKAPTDWLIGQCKKAIQEAR